MKYRKSFVTNSSSSSFVCDICGRVEIVWDTGLSDVGMYQCVNGHTFCKDEALEISKEDLIEVIVEDKWNKSSKEELEKMELEELMEYFDVGDVPECFCPICNFIEYSQSDLARYLLKEYDIPRNEVFEEVKSLNKRRKKLYNNEYIAYVCKKFDLKPYEIVAFWKERFGTYVEFSRYLG